jgi:hypothetical protein
VDIILNPSRAVVRDVMWHKNGEHSAVSRRPAGGGVFYKTLNISARVLQDHRLVRAAWLGPNHPEEPEKAGIFSCWRCPAIAAVPISRVTGKFAGACDSTIGRSIHDRAVDLDRRRAARGRNNNSN